ncbi:hypothetical protein HYG81_15170 [Natrinema zhouii]|uniref:Uncharacterized protein n=1 Tax=Natrinema zhouii TaxID=1710539 RepID=A0A7D6CNX4_9EURY|nr:hypothetical protein [Natrinema zhouii]QLK25414.1 hypothetical protein HYG81_15170 [Natrinema zhouii]
MPDTGYCTVDDVRRAKQDSELTGELVSVNNEIVVDAITAQTEWLEKKLSRHWYVSTRPDEDTHGLLPIGPKSRDDEEDIPTGGASIVGEPVTPKTWQGSYTRIELDRRDAESITELLVRTPDGYEDWVGSSEYSGGTWPDALGDDYYLRINNGGVSQLYLDTENLLDEDDEPLLESYSNAVYVTFDYGHEGIPDTVRKAVAMRACAKLLIDDESALGIPDNGQLVNPESKKQAMESAAEELLEVYL